MSGVEEAGASTGASTSASTPASTVATTPARVPWPALAAFVMLAFGLAWLVALPLWLDRGLRNPLAGLLLPAMMFTPAIAALVVVFFVQRPRPAAIAAYLGVWPLRPAWRIIGLCLAGLFGTVLLSVASVFLSAAFGAIRLDLGGFSGFAETVEAQLAAAGVHELPVSVGVLVALQLALIPLGALVNCFVTVGEELGWRGWLLPSLRPLGTWPALLITGAIWGLWHSPVILLGYDFAEPNLLGVLMMTGGCTAYGVLIGWLRLRSGSVWPAVVAHGAFNASAGVGALLLAAGSPADGFSLLPLGWPGWVVCAAVAGVLAAAGQFRKQPELVRRPRSRTRPQPLRTPPAPPAR